MLTRTSNAENVQIGFLQPFTREQSTVSLQELLDQTMIKGCADTLIFTAVSMEGELVTGKASNIGCMIAQRITNALVGEGIMYERLASIIYKECIDITLEMDLGDWLEMPNGDTYTKTFSVKRYLENGGTSL